ncbi:MAG: XdhC family protein, partial [Veillonella sp.]|nr:XdhC family protein [Veillonella sp.]
CLPLENFKNDLPLDEYTGFIIVTRAHEYDNICLEQLRGYLPTYMGVMGSQKRIHHAFEVLREQGWTQDELDMVYAPIGLDLGAQTPEEIALSIVSEYLAVVRLVNVKTKP